MPTPTNTIKIRLFIFCSSRTHDAVHDKTKPEKRRARQEKEVNFETLIFAR
jgi:hypothetical protein